MNPKSRLVVGLVLGSAATSCQYAYDIDRAQLMPEPVARAVLAKHVGQPWAKAPYIYDEYAGGRQVYIDIRQLTWSRWSFNGLQTGIGGPSWPLPCLRRIWFESVDTNDEALEVTQALVALGASFGR